jgi:starch-binding outer membrane protein, SusD/RagB family
MTTKHKISLLLFPVLLLCMLSCNKDFLDRNPLNSVSTDIFWTSEADVQTAVTGVYTRLQQNFLGYERVYLDGLSDNAYLGVNTNLGGMSQLTIGSISAGSGTSLNAMYSTPYRAITSCNYFLDNVDKAPISDAKKNAAKAEVRFVRALAYFDLVQTFGGVVINTSFPKTVEEEKKPKSTADQVYTLIHQDLDFAIANLLDDKYNGHAVKGSALGLKARVLITQQKFNEAVPLLQQVMSSGKFALANNYTLLFRSAGQANAAVNTEIMFSTQYLAPTNPQRTSPGAGGMDLELGLYSLLQPYKDLVDEYEMTDGKLITESPLYNPALPYANRDPRLDMSIKLPGEVWKSPAGTEFTGFTVSSTGFYMEKYVDLSKPAPFTTATATATDVDYIHLRYADILLMYAEAKNEVSGPDATVYAALNQVRARPTVNMPPVDQAKYNTQALLRNFIRHERRVELALEGQRYNDLKRWNIAHIKLPTLKDPTGRSLVFEMKHYFLPFPQVELDTNPNLVQNPGY